MGSSESSIFTVDPSHKIEEFQGISGRNHLRREFGRTASFSLKFGAANMPSPSVPSVRLTSLDQFRGYTMFGMLLVNFLGSYSVCPRILKHTHDYCSYADTIMPQFLFAAGFAMRLSLGKRRESGGKMPWGRAVRRILGLALVAIVWYTICDLKGIVENFNKKPVGEFLVVLFKREYFQTLLHIAATSLWILPVVTASSKVRVWYAIASGILHFLISWWFNFVWVHSDPGGIDGGPLGFLSWAVPALCGTLACDAVRASGPSAALRIAVSGFGVALLGWVMSIGTVLYNVPEVQASTSPPNASTAPVSDSQQTSAVGAEQSPKPAAKPRNEKLAPDPVVPSMERLRAWDGTIVEPPFVPPPDYKHRKWNYWMMSQRSGNLSYPTFAAGVSLIIYALCLWLCDGRGLRLGFFRTLGTNSLAAYILHDIAGWIISTTNYFPEKSSSAIMAMVGFACFTLFVYAWCRLLERLGWYIRV